MPLGARLRQIKALLRAGNSDEKNAELLVVAGAGVADAVEVLRESEEVVVALSFTPSGVVD